MTEKEYLIALCAFIPFGPARLKLLLSFFGNAKKVWSAKENDLKNTGIKDKTLEGFIRHRDNFNFSDYFDRLKKLQVFAVTQEEVKYWENLRQIDTAPLVLYYKGSIRKADDNAIAIVGSRKMTSYGREATERFSAELAGMGITIVSGLARGIDTCAHEKALEVGGRTIAVLACGLDSIYPPENFRLAKKIEENGAIVSEYPLGYPTLPSNFPSRNRIISGISKAILVVEGEEKSGTLLTASHAAEQGKTVFAVPGQITSPLSKAPHFLIKNGARMVTEVKDILDELNLQIKVDRDTIDKIMPTTKDEQKLLEYLENEPLHIDEIVRISSYNIADVSARLTVMEMKGMVRNVGGGIYKKVI